MNLVIGNTSQLSYYFPNDYEKISSRNIDFNLYKNKNYDRVYLCFAEQRLFLKGVLDFYKKINVDYTLTIIDFFKNISKKIIVYSTGDLWSNCNGAVDIDTPYNYNYSPYIKSKEILCNILKEKYKDVIIVYPFNFNSRYRREGFLFSKIFDSIINNKVIEIGDTYFYRDMIHPKHVVNMSIETNENIVVGSGRLTFINDFIQDLYKSFNMNYSDMVKEDDINNMNVKRNIFYMKSKICMYNYENLLLDTVYDIKNNNEK